MARRKSVQLKAGGRSSPTVSAHAQQKGRCVGQVDAGLAVAPPAPSRCHFGFRTKKSAPSKCHFVTARSQILRFRSGDLRNAFPTLPHAPRCICDVRNGYSKITPNLPPASCWNPGSVPILALDSPTYGFMTRTQIQHRRVWQNLKVRVCISAIALCLH